MKRLILLCVTLGLAGCVAPAPPPVQPAPAATAPPNPLVGGAVLDPSRSLAQHAATSPVHSTLLSALRSAGVEPVLGAGSYTLFAPTDAAFSRLPNGTLPSLLDPANRPLLGRVLRYHIVPGAKTRAQIEADLRAGYGVATYRTLEGNVLRVTASGGVLWVSDIHGNRVPAEITDVRSTTGVMHVLAGVLIPTV
jgi:uncharacterized surface protein with fasciclin (FAS1) repeats